MRQTARIMPHFLKKACKHCNIFEEQQLLDSQQRLAESQPINSLLTLMDFFVGKPTKDDEEDAVDRQTEMRQTHSDDLKYEQKTLNYAEVKDLGDVNVRRYRSISDMESIKTHHSSLDDNLQSQSQTSESIANDELKCLLRTSKKLRHHSKAQKCANKRNACQDISDTDYYCCPEQHLQTTCGAKNCMKNAASQTTFEEEDIFLLDSKTSLQQRQQKNRQQEQMKLDCRQQQHRHQQHERQYHKQQEHSAWEYGQQEHRPEEYRQQEHRHGEYGQQEHRPGEYGQQDYKQQEHIQCEQNQLDHGWQEQKQYEHSQQDDNQQQKQKQPGTKIRETIKTFFKNNYFPSSSSDENFKNKCSNTAAAARTTGQTPSEPILAHSSEHANYRQHNEHEQIFEDIKESLSDVSSDIKPFDRTNSNISIKTQLTLNSATELRESIIKDCQLEASIDLRMNKLRQYEAERKQAAENAKKFKLPTMSTRQHDREQHRADAKEWENGIVETCCEKERQFKPERHEKSAWSKSFYAQTYLPREERKAEQERDYKSPAKYESLQQQERVTNRAELKKQIEEELKERAKAREQAKAHTCLLDKFEQTDFAEANAQKHNKSTTLANEGKFPLKMNATNATPMQEVAYDLASAMQPNLLTLYFKNTEPQQSTANQGEFLAKNSPLQEEKHQYATAATQNAPAEFCHYKRECVTYEIREQQQPITLQQKPLYAPYQLSPQKQQHSMDASRQYHSISLQQHANLPTEFSNIEQEVHNICSKRNFCRHKERMENPYYAQRVEKPQMQFSPLSKFQKKNSPKIAKNSIQQHKNSIQKPYNYTTTQPIFAKAADAQNTKWPPLRPELPTYTKNNCCQHCGKPIATNCNKVLIDDAAAASQRQYEDAAAQQLFEIIKNKVAQPFLRKLQRSCLHNMELKLDMSEDLQRLPALLLKILEAQTAV